MNRKSSPRKEPAPVSEKPPKGPAAGSKNQAVGSKPSPVQRPPNLASLRGEIDRLDQELVQVLESPRGDRRP